MGWIASLLGAFVQSSFIRALLAQALVTLGISMVTIGGFSVAWEAIRSGVINNYGGLPSDVLVYFSIAKVPNALSVILSAYASGLGIRGLTSVGVLKRVVWKGGSGSVIG